MIAQFSHWVSYGSDDKRTTKINVVSLLEHRLVIVRFVQYDLDY
jgi:hypothetical protein